MWSGAQAARYALKADTFANPLDLEFGSEADSPQRETVSEAAVGGSGALNPAETSPVFSFIPTSRHNQPLPPPSVSGTCVRMFMSSGKSLLR